MKLDKSSKLYEQASKQVNNLCAQDIAWFNSTTVNNQEKLLSVLACSEFVSSTCQKHKGLIVTLSNAIDADPATQPESVTYELGYELAIKTAIAPLTSEPQLNTVLRQIRNTEMAKIAARDSLQCQTIQDSLKQVSHLADALIMGAYRWIYQFCVNKYGAPENEQSLYIIAMGKLGAQELNFSSDIDLIFTYPEKGDTSGQRKSIEHHVFFTRVAQRLIQSLDKVTHDGQVYRVDMRLRPFGESGPLVMHFDAFSDYYHEHARQWERFAMVKARILNPQDKDSAELTRIITPFVYKRYLDFTTLDSLRTMKDKIFADSRRRHLGENIKLGKGGIREAEFYVQYFQLIYAGQAPQLQVRNWYKVLTHLTELEHVEWTASKQLAHAYFILREVEHGLQQIRNAQTQTLPDNEDDWLRLVIYTNASSISQLKDEITQSRLCIHTFFNTLFHEGANEESTTEAQGVSHPESAVRHGIGQIQSLWLGNYESEELKKTLQGYLENIPENTSNTTHCVIRNNNSKDNASVIAIALLNLKQKSIKVHLSHRAQLVVDQLIPVILYEALHTKQISATSLTSVLAILSSTLGRTTYLELLHDYPKVRHQLISLCGASPWIAEQVKRFPLLLDELLSQAYVDNTPKNLTQVAAEYTDELRQELLRVDLSDVEHHMNVLRQFKLCQQFRIAAADIHGSLPIEHVSDKLTILSQVIVSHVIETAYTHCVKRYGVLEHSDSPLLNFAAIAYGKMGGFELGYGSDLDVVLVHDAPINSYTTGSKSISAQQFYIKLAQRAIHILNTKTLLGELYETDLRLRPAGSAGLLCCHIQGFEQYQNNEAWTWEHQALVRARVVFGGESITRKINTLRDNVLRKNRDIETLTKEIVDMRQKLFIHSKPNILQDALKRGKGGITDIEFMSQFFVLAHAHNTPSLTKWRDNLRIIDEATATQLIPQSLAIHLKESYLILRSEMHKNLLEGNDSSEQNGLILDTTERVHRAWLAILPAYTLFE